MMHQVKIITFLTLFMVVTISAIGCKEKNENVQEAVLPTSEKFHDYWFQGLAEISRFELEQARYNQMRKGDAVLIFVTEQFLTEKQVKSEKGAQPGAIPILKLNLIKQFVTGIYDYSMMTSIFTPTDTKQYPRTLKSTTSVQEWCGQTYTQFNLEKGQYHVRVHSYFMDEADQDYFIIGNQMEDAVWPRIRLGPGFLPTGEIRMIPGAQYSRLKHVKQKPEIARATLEAGDELYVYHIQYEDLPRSLKIEFKKTFPYEIMAWEETTGDRDEKQNLLVTRAKRTHILKKDYWNLNSVDDVTYREQLGLKCFE